MGMAGFHSVASKSGFESRFSFCTQITGGLVGVIGATIIGGEAGGVHGGEGKEAIEEPDDTEADSGLQESFRRHLQSIRYCPRIDLENKAYLSLQYRRELSGTVICLSHMAL